MIDYLKTFLVVVEQGNFSRAAEMLHITQPTVSTQMKNLETYFNCSLLFRSSKQVFPTQAGEVLYTNAQKMMNILNETEEKMNDIRNQIGGTLKIGTSYTIGEYIVPKVLAAFTEEYPDVHLEIVISNTEDTVKLMKTNQIDIGLIEGQTDAKGLTEFPFMEDELVMVAASSHPLARKKHIDLKDLQHLVWVRREIGSGTRSHTDQFLRKLNISEKKLYVFNSNQGVIEGVAAGLGVGFISKLTVVNELKLGRLVPIQLKDYIFTRNFTFILHTDKVLNKTVEAFTSFIKSIERKDDAKNGK